MKKRLIYVIIGLLVGIFYYYYYAGSKTCMCGHRRHWNWKHGTEIYSLNPIKQSPEEKYFMTAEEYARIKYGD